MSIERHAYQVGQQVDTYGGERVKITKADTWLDGCPVYHAQVDGADKIYTDDMIRCAVATAKEER